MSEDLFDFGFSAVDYDPDQAREVEEAKDSYEKAFTMLMEDVSRLLDNLASNPDKDYIYWPNRVDKIDAFRARIASYAPR
jgi:hypothetical protein